MTSLKDLAKDSQTHIVDVRSLAEFESGHIANAIHIPLEEVPHRYSELAEIGTRPVIFYCRSGNRSGMAVRYLQQQGIANIYNGGGLEDVQQLFN